jgi:N-methylhydantoinase A
VHGVALAEEMGMAEVVVPEAPGVLAAFGLLAAAIEHHHARTLHCRADDVDLEAVNRCLAELDEAGHARMREEGVPLSGVEVSYAADMRYVGQAYELEVAIDAPLSPARVGEAVRGFHQAHERVYGYARTEQPVELVNFAAVHRYPLPRPVLSPPAPAAGTIGEARVGERRAYFAPAGFVATALYDRARLPQGSRVTGPAIVEQADTTSVIPPGHVAVVEASGNLRIRRA